MVGAFVLEVPGGKSGHFEHLCARRAGVDKSSWHDKLSARRSMNLRWRQPSRQGRRWEGHPRPSRWSVTGTSVMRMPDNVASISISAANSIPGARRDRLRKETSENPRSPH